LSHMFLEAKTTKLIDSLEIASVKFMNSVVERRQDVEGGNDDLVASPRGRAAHGMA
jgi:biopolymer transport protein ExbB